MTTPNYALECDIAALATDLFEFEATRVSLDNLRSSILRCSYCSGKKKRGKEFTTPKKDHQCNLTEPCVLDEPCAHCVGSGQKPAEAVRPEKLGAVENALQQAAGLEEDTKTALGLKMVEHPAWVGFQKLPMAIKPEWAGRFLGAIKSFDNFRCPSRMISYCMGYLKDGKRSPHSRRANAWLRATADTLLRQAGREGMEAVYYRPFYDTARADVEAAHPEWKDWQKHGTALASMMREWQRDLWCRVHGKQRWNAQGEVLFE
ncbi:hypothetical protein LCGC14_1905760 [marine sediment metagenome]|uniref:Uncharacterized protein n=1 Tax=marine sediment metagenome TaxID=412755 RepID=A0A0F9I947_9ZZZZ